MTPWPVTRSRKRRAHSPRTRCLRSRRRHVACSRHPHTLPTRPTPSTPPLLRHAQSESPLTPIAGSRAPLKLTVDTMISGWPEIGIGPPGPIFFQPDETSPASTLRVSSRARLRTRMRAGSTRRASRPRRPWFPSHPRDGRCWDAPASRAPAPALRRRIAPRPAGLLVIDLDLPVQADVPAEQDVLRFTRGLASRRPPARPGGPVRTAVAAPPNRESGTASSPRSRSCAISEPSRESARAGCGGSRVGAFGG
jgi:hypothetical protein